MDLGEKTGHAYREKKIITVTAPNIRYYFISKVFFLKFLAVYSIFPLFIIFILIIFLLIKIVLLYWTKGKQVKC